MSATADANAQAAGRQPPPPPPPVAPKSRRSEDREFLPAALEILETPPSPARMYLILLICAFVAVGLTWSFFGRIDIIAIAQGKIQPSGRVKMVQPVETGKVRQVHVVNGTRVHEGDLLIELDDSDARADERSLRTTLAAIRAEIIRRTRSLALARARDFNDPKAQFPDEIPEQVRLREAKVLAGDVGQLATALESLMAQSRQKGAELTRLQDTIVSQEKLVSLQQQRVTMRATLQASRAGSMASLIDAQESMQYQMTALAQQKGQLGETRAALETLDREMSKLVETFIAENTQKLADAERQADEFGQRLVRASVRVGNLALRAPVSGVVQNLTVTTVGQVVMPGEELLRIVPEDRIWEIECYLPNKDIGFVKVGQEAVVKIESFPFTRYGSLEAKVIRVGEEAIPEPEAQQQESSAGKAPQRTNWTGGAQRVQNLVFPLTLLPDQTSINVDGVSVPISNGMAVSVEIRTGSRRIIDYVFSPLVEVTSQALKER